MQLKNIATVFCISIILSMSAFPKSMSDIMKSMREIRIRLVVGFSTGHTGTTTLSNRTSYDLENKLVWFFFEQSTVNRTDYSKNFTIYDEINHVENDYGPRICWIARMVMRNNRHLWSGRPHNATVTVVDLSHSSLYFYRGLISVMDNFREQISLDFIRIRRDRIETAISMIGGKIPFFEYDYFRYHPLENEPNVILKLGDQIWQNLTTLEQLFWVIDETEARWRCLLEAVPDLVFEELWWSSRGLQSLNESVRSVAAFVGVKSAPLLVVHKPHASESLKKNASVYVEFSQADMVYRQKMVGVLPYDQMPNLWKSFDGSTV